MSTISEAAPASSLAGAGPVRSAWSLSRTLADALARRRTARAIADLDDHLLRDIGLLGAKRLETRLPFGRADLW